MFGELVGWGMEKGDNRSKGNVGGFVDLWEGIQQWGLPSRAAKSVIE